MNDPIKTKLSENQNQNWKLIGPFFPFFGPLIPGISSSHPQPEDPQCSTTWNKLEKRMEIKQQCLQEVLPSILLLNSHSHFQLIPNILTLKASSFHHFIFLRFQYLRFSTPPPMVSVTLTCQYNCCHGTSPPPRMQPSLHLTNQPDQPCRKLLELLSLLRPLDGIHVDERVTQDLTHKMRNKQGTLVSYTCKYCKNSRYQCACVMDLSQFLIQIVTYASYIPYRVQPHPLSHPLPHPGGYKATLHTVKHSKTVRAGDATGQYRNASLIQTLPHLPSPAEGP